MGRLGCEIYLRCGMFAMWDVWDVRCWGCGMLIYKMHAQLTIFLKIIQNLNPDIAHGHDEISIRMLKLCGDSLCRPLELIFKDCLTNGIFPSDWKKGNIVSVHKKNNKQCLNNCRPISLLPICSKIFERLIIKKMFGFFIENDLISQHRSGFKPGDSCINQLLSITHEIYEPFDDGFDVRRVFRDLSKAFDKV